MRAIFISYRREDAEGQAGRLFDDLVRHFGPGAVFMDVATIEAGRDFRRAIDDQVASCGVLLAMIGKRWLDAVDGEGHVRLDNPHDFVRLETASALKRDIPVIPVLVQGAKMPRPEQLPPDLAELVFRNGVELTHARWDSDVQVLIKALGGLGLLPLQPGGSSAAPGHRRSVLPIAAAVAAIVTSAAGYVIYNATRQPEPQPPKNLVEPTTRPADAAGTTTAPPGAKSPEPSTGSMTRGAAVPPETRRTKPKTPSPIPSAEPQPISEPARPASESNTLPPPPSIVGLWQGWYRCAQGETGARITVERVAAGTFEGRFDFYPLASNPLVPPGSYVLRVIPGGTQTTLVPSRWVQQPAGFVMVGLRGVVSADGTQFRGRVTDPDCQDFAFQRIR